MRYGDKIALDWKGAFALGASEEQLSLLAERTVLVRGDPKPGITSPQISPQPDPCHSSVIGLLHMSIILDISESDPGATTAACHPTIGRRDDASGESLMARPTLAVVGHLAPAVPGEGMTSSHALSALAALGQPSRLEIFRLLMRHAPSGLPAGEIAQTIGCPHNTLSSHLGILARAGLVRGFRDGRSIIYRADVDGMRSLVAFLVNDCCAGRPELCDLQDALSASACCAPPTKRKPRRT
jgi:ArsR family transcriptional regulator, arsenate/arsenite/antimonite-responsive transcriptional repressor